MGFDKDIERFRRLDQLIRLESTGSPRELAEKMNVSERKIYGCLESMKMMGAPIHYNRHRQSYVYGKKGKFQLGFEEFRFVSQPRDASD